jgi:hypothetical protein
MNDIETISDQWAEWRQRRDKAIGVNLRLIFDALAARGIEHVKINFDGCADDGQVQVVNVGGNALGSELIIEAAPWVGANEMRTCSLIEAIEALCYELLEREAADWEVNDGAFGSFSFHVAARSIDLEFNGRILTYDTSVRTFTEA